MPLVYRIEHAQSKEGPYRFFSKNPKIDSMLWKHNECVNHPSPDVDFKYNIFHNELYCGLTDEESLKKWFKGFRTSLNRLGFIMAIYKVPANKKAFYKGKTSNQVLFWRAKSKLLETKKIP